MKILLTGGGTGGHIYPALALQKRMKERYPEAEFLYVGTMDGLESHLVPRVGIPFASVDIQGFKRKLSLYNFETLYKFFTSIRESKRILEEFQPDVVLGTGGYVCGPVVYAAAKLGIPSVIHEQNSVPGLTNKFLARYVDKIALSFEAARDYFKNADQKLVYAGNPRAQEVADLEKKPALEEFGLDSNQPTVLIFGGSRGAFRINEIVAESFSELSKKPYQVLFVSGEFYYEEMVDEYPEMKEDTNFKMEAYIPNMPEVLTNIDLIVGRSGATSLAEITALGIPSILIPSPNVTDDHQTKNAKALVDQDAALMLAEVELTSKDFLEAVDALMLDEERRIKMANNAKNMGVPDASDRLIDIMVSEINNKGRLYE